jgi:hypothetical protein
MKTNLQIQKNVQTPYYYFLLIVIPTLMMCRNGNDTKPVKLDLFEAYSERHCFRAVDQKDTAILHMVTYGKGMAKGHLLIKYAGKKKNEGNFTGFIKKDTLYLTYHFYVGNDSLRTFTNPLALLKKQDTLILGVGKILHKLGRSFFDQNVPVNYDRGRFHFGIVQCR